MNTYTRLVDAVDNDPAPCHPDCGPIDEVSTDGTHSHRNPDGICHHENGDDLT